MAPKKRSAASASSSRAVKAKASSSQPLPSQDVPLLLPPPIDSSNEQEEFELEKIRVANLVAARNFVFERFFAPKEDLKFWRTCQTLQLTRLLAKDTKKEANHTVVLEYYASRKLLNKKAAVVRQKRVHITASRIRCSFRLPSPSEPCAFKEYVQGRLQLSDDEIAQTLCIPGQRAWKVTPETSTLLGPSLTLEGKVWQYFVQRNLSPVAHLHTIKKEIAALMCLLAQGRYVDVAQVMVDYLDEAAQSPASNHSFVFPFLITDFCYDAGVETRADDVTSSLLYPVSYKRLGFGVSRRARNVEDVVMEDADAGDDVVMEARPF